MEVSVLKYYDIDREGWIGITGSLAETNGRLDLCDVKDGVYLVIDSDGYFYEAREDDESRWGYRWKRTDRREMDIAMMLREHVHGEQLSGDELDFVR
ncbi:hypothetical protein [Rubritalea tangerina]|uniref:DUF5348 domain-containing protein n=1 Tax=Rubritalea tangerina TaxID=430798 RepID=A0ABW4ZB95_9BACT